MRSSNASSGAVHVVESPASRDAFSAYACRRSRDAGHVPTSVCQSRFSNGPSPVGATSRSCPSASRHASGVSESTSMRARTSSPRFVSCVESVVMACGAMRCRSCWRAWKSSTSIAKIDGSAPTSLSETRRE